jgi:hypothetical protein
MADATEQMMEQRPAEAEKNDLPMIEPKRP